VAAATYAAHGLCVRSEIPLPLEEGPSGTRADVEIVRGATTITPDEAPPGESVWSIGEPPARTWWSLAGQTWRIRLPRLCELRIEPPWRRLEVDVSPDAHPDTLGDRIVKTGVLFALERQGQHMLHASAVHIRGTTIALIGAPASGKSTLAALLCADGGSLVSDDQLRVELGDDDDAVTCHRGSGPIRLRPAMRHVADLLGGGTGDTWDGRTTVSPAAQLGSRRLDVLVLPRLTARLDGPQVDRLDVGEAILALAATRATPGVQEWIRARFHLHASLVARLPAFALRLPLGRVPTAAERAGLLDQMTGAAA
jgi:hypothetical protein